MVAGSSTTPCSSARVAIRLTDASSNRKFAYGGAVLEWRQHPALGPIAFGIRGLAGYGQATMTSTVSLLNDDGYGPIGRMPPATTTTVTTALVRFDQGFFVVEPQAELVVSLARWARLTWQSRLSSDWRRQRHGEPAARSLRRRRARVRRHLVSHSTALKALATICRGDSVVSWSHRALCLRGTGTWLWRASLRTRAFGCAMAGSLTLSGGNGKEHGDVACAQPVRGDYALQRRAPFRTLTQKVRTKYPKCRSVPQGEADVSESRLGPRSLQFEQIGLSVVGLHGPSAFSKRTDGDWRRPSA